MGSLLGSVELNENSFPKSKYQMIFHRVWVPICRCCLSSARRRWRRRHPWKICDICLKQKLHFKCYLQAKTQAAEAAANSFVSFNQVKMFLFLEKNATTFMLMAHQPWGFSSTLWCNSFSFSSSQLQSVLNTDVIGVENTYWSLEQQLMYTSEWVDF